MHILKGPQPNSMNRAAESSQVLHSNLLSQPGFPQAQSPAWSSSFQPRLTLLHTCALTRCLTVLICCVPPGKEQPGRHRHMKVLSSLPGAAMEKTYVSMFLLLVAISCALAKDVGKKETTAKPKLPQTLSRGKKKTTKKQAKLGKKSAIYYSLDSSAVLISEFSCIAL